MRGGEGVSKNSSFFGRHKWMTPFDFNEKVWLTNDNFPPELVV